MQECSISSVQAHIVKSLHCMHHNKSMCAGFETPFEVGTSSKLDELLSARSAMCFVVSCRQVIVLLQTHRSVSSKSYVGQSFFCSFDNASLYKGTMWSSDCTASVLLQSLFSVVEFHFVKTLCFASVITICHSERWCCQFYLMMACLNLDERLAIRALLRPYVVCEMVFQLSFVATH